jgi:hypothetical protein
MAKCNLKLNLLALIVVVLWADTYVLGIDANEIIVSKINSVPFAQEETNEALAEYRLPSYGFNVEKVAPYLRVITLQQMIDFLKSKFSSKPAKPGNDDILIQELLEQGYSLRLVAQKAKGRHNKYKLKPTRAEEKAEPADQSYSAIADVLSYEKRVEEDQRFVDPETREIEIENSRNNP